MQSPSRSVQLSLDGNGSPLNQQLRPAQSSAAMDERTVAAAAGKSSKSVAKNKHLGGIDIPNRWKIISMLYQLPSPALICKRIAAAAANMELSLVATHIGRLLARPKLKDIYLVLANICTEKSLPSRIYEDPPDYILQFETANDQEIVYHQSAIITPTYRLGLSKWTPYYKNHSKPWNLKVKMIITGIPERSVGPDVLNPLLGAYCDIRGFKYDTCTSTCRITAYTSEIEAVPTTGVRIAIEPQENQNSTPQIVSVDISTAEFIDPPPMTAADYISYGYHPSLVDTALQTGLDIDVLEELHRQQERRMKRMEYIGSQQTAAVETRAWWTMTTTNEQLSIHAHRRVHPLLQSRVRQFGHRQRGTLGSRASMLEEGLRSKHEPEKRLLLIPGSTNCIVIDIYNT